MDLYVCGRNPLIRPQPCSRHYSDASNDCSHVPSGRVHSAEPGNEACPLLASRPRLVFDHKEAIELKSVAAENIVILGNTEPRQYVHCRDGPEERVSESTVDHLTRHVNSQDIQDLWVASYPSDMDSADILFSPSYPLAPVPPLGMVTYDGAVFYIKQQPFEITEMTTTAQRAPFRHVLIRKEWDTEQDVWPMVVLPHQSDVIYRFCTLVDLTTWLGGSQVPFQRIHVSSPVSSLYATPGRAAYCLALSECGSIYYWRRSGTCGTRMCLSLKEAYATPASLDSSNATNDAQGPPPGRIDVPPSSKCALGSNFGAALTRDGEIWLFSLRSPVAGLGPIPLPAELQDETLPHGICPAFLPRRAGVNDIPDLPKHTPRFIDIAAGDNHLVALAATNRVFTIGSGFQGALGIGAKQFQLGKNRTPFFQQSHEQVEYSEDWQEMDLSDVTGGKDCASSHRKIVKVAAGEESTLIIVE